jgi:hypothetical protein
VIRTFRNVDDVVHIRLGKHVGQPVCNVYIKASREDVIKVRKKIPSERNTFQVLTGGNGVAAYTFELLRIL